MNILGTVLAAAMLMAASAYAEDPRTHKTSLTLFLIDNDRGVTEATIVENGYARLKKLCALIPPAAGSAIS